MQIMIQKMCGPRFYITNKFPANANPQTEPIGWEDRQKGVALNNDIKKLCNMKNCNWQLMLYKLRSN